MEEDAAVLEVQRGPLPEEAGDPVGDGGLGIGGPDRPDAPGTVPRADRAGCEDPAHAVYLNPSRHPDVHGQPRVVHEGPGPVPVDEPGLLDREGPAFEGEVGGDPVARLDNDPEGLEGLDHLDADRPRRDVHALHVQEARGVQAVLHPVADHREMGIGDVQVRIDAEGDGEELGSVRLIAIEEVTVVEVPVGSREGDRLRGLVNWIVVALGQHVPSSAGRGPP